MKIPSKTFHFQNSYKACFKFSLSHRLRSKMLEHFEGSFLGRDQTKLVTLIYQNNLHVFFFQLKECIKYYSWKFFDFENKYLSEENKKLTVIFLSAINTCTAYV